MALKDIFTMVKADRYTADGCEVLNKAREADVEDRRYNIGEISEKTGLQKTANGWVKPKSGNKPDAAETPGAQRGTKEFDKNEYIDSMKNSKNAPVSRMAREIQRETFDDEIKNTSGDKAKIEALTKQLLSPAIESGAKITAEAQERAKNLVESRYRQLTVTESKPKAIRWNRENLNEMRGNEEYINAKAADNYYHQYGLDKIGEWKDRKGWTVKEYQNDDGETYRAKYNGEKYVGSEYDPTGVILSPENKDAAPRVLTGDTRIRVRKA